MELHDPSKKPAIEAVSCPSYFAEAPNCLGEEESHFHTESRVSVCATAPSLRSSLRCSRCSHLRSHRCRTDDPSTRRRTVSWLTTSISTRMEHLSRSSESPATIVATMMEQSSGAT